MPSSYKLRFLHQQLTCSSASLLVSIRASILFLSLISSAHASPKYHIYENGPPELGKPFNLTCSAESNDTSLWWSRNGLNLTATEAASEGIRLYDGYNQKGKIATLEFINLSLSHYNSYVCHSEGWNRTRFVSVDLSAEIDLTVSENTTLGAEVIVTCKVTGYPLHSDIWWKFKDGYLQNSSFVTITHGISNITQRESIIRISNISDSDNGTYFCHSEDVQPKGIFVRVYGPPIVLFDVIRPVGKSEIFLNWTLNDRNSNLTDLTLEFTEGTETNRRNMVDIQEITDRYVLKTLEANTQYKDFTIIGRNRYGKSENTRSDQVRTLNKDPSFVPVVQVKGISPTSVSLGWNTPSSQEYYHYYRVILHNPLGKNKTRTAYGDSYIAEGLSPRTSYSFQVQACSEYTQNCDGLSPLQNATTMDGTSSEPLNVKCNVDSATIQSTWDKPRDPRGQIIEYLLTLKGTAQYISPFGNITKEDLPPQQKFVTVNKPMKIDFINQPPNTNFTIRVCAITESKQCGAPGEATCTTPVSPPSPEELNKVSWLTHKESGKILFRVTLPPISQRNGSICCLRVVIVRLPKTLSVDKLPPPGQMSEKLTSYEVAHNNLETEGAYVAEIFDSNRLTAWKNHKALRINIGDEDIGAGDTPSACHACWPDNPGITGSYRTSKHFPGATDVLKKHRKRHAASTTSFNPDIVRDGPLDSGSVYTGFVVAHTVIKRDAFQNQVLTSTSEYFTPLLAREETVMSGEEAVEQLGAKVIGLLVITLLAVFATLLCVMRWRRKEPGEEYGLFPGWGGECWRRLLGQIPIRIHQPNRPPIPKDQLVAAYLERHESSDAGFQKEFEDLPDQFPDRTTKATDENISKNRFPDIRAYDQTRVKLSKVDGGSDYINANIVVGYKERKKFICAQGPMDITVNDWWRMVWEQRVHIIIMLTNLEENSRQKCHKYWPSEGSADYGNICVTKHAEKRYSDYLLRTLKLRLNGAEGETAKEERDVEQFHYLVWKDYSAPEYPIGIIRFIKRYNAVYEMQKGHILVHCSAGVGRTGTLVALDSLLQQLNEEGQISIYNTIWDLRHQRNFLVQSLKQYIFIYRALMEAALFGDTEIAVGELKPSLEKLRYTAEGKTVTLMEEEFEGLKQVVEDTKVFSTGVLEENRHRNRHDYIIPYDRNRVILSPTPRPNKEICTYINASFIDGYDESEQYIIAQDPLDVTVSDFWRMIVERNIRTVVMLSETGEDKCLRYWPEKDQETEHDFNRVKYMQSESFPYYYKREFTVTKIKGEESCLVTQFQYSGWPVGESEVPESARGIVELVDKIFKHMESLDKDKTFGPTLVHCSAGTDRSCIFVALAILVRQMMTESRIDVFSVVRKLRSQRQGLFQNLAQYEFLYKGLDTYADLHVANGNTSH